MAFILQLKITRAAEPWLVWKQEVNSAESGKGPLGNTSQSAHEMTFPEQGTTAWMSVTAGANAITAISYSAPKQRADSMCVTREYVLGVCH